MASSTSIKKVKVSDLIPYANNSRTHSDEQVLQIAASIKEFGFLNPIIIDSDNGIIAGHGRVMAAKKLGIDELPCIDMESLPKSYAKNGVKDCLCNDCGTEFTVRKDTSPIVCKRCVSARGGKSSTGARVPHRKCAAEGCRNTFPEKQRRTYCSPECRWDGIREVRTCKMCAAEFKVLKSTIREKTNASGNFCSRPCYEKYLCKTGRTTGRGSQWKRIRDEVINKFPFCAKCGTTKNLQVHHITPFRLTQDNSKQNLIPLCTKHHKEIEMMFVETERFGVTKDTEIIWRNMLRSMQSVTAFRIKEVKNATT